MYVEKATKIEFRACRLDFVAATFHLPEAVLEAIYVLEI